MSKTILGQYNDFIQSRKVKLINMLFSEIIFLKSKFKSTNKNEEISYLKEALGKLEYLLDKLKENSSEISEGDFDKITMIIYHIFKEIAIKLD